MKIQIATFLGFWNHIKLRTRPSFAFFILAILFGLIIGGILGGTLALASAWAFERLAPPKPISSKGLMRNRTKGILNIVSIAILIQMINFFIRASELDSYNSVGRLVGVPTEWAFGSSTGLRTSINFYGFLIATWVGYQAYLAKRLGMVHWMWVFGSFAVAFLPFLSFFLGPLWLLVDSILIIVLALSSFLFRLPQEWPTAAPTSLPIQQSKDVGKLESELTSLKRLLDSGLLSQEEFLSQKNEVLRRFNDGV